MPFDEGWLAIIHEVEHVNRQRRYCHRFIWMDSGNTLRRLSRRFYLKKLGVEFVAGMAWHFDDARLVISFSEHDPRCFLRLLTQTTSVLCCWVSTNIDGRVSKLLRLAARLGNDCAPEKSRLRESPNRRTRQVTCARPKPPDAS